MKESEELGPCPSHLRSRTRPTGGPAAPLSTIGVPWKFLESSLGVHWELLDSDLRVPLDLEFLLFSSLVLMCQKF